MCECPDDLGSKRIAGTHETSCQHYDPDGAWYCDDCNMPTGADHACVEVDDYLFESHDDVQARDNYGKSRSYLR